MLDGLVLLGKIMDNNDGPRKRSFSGTWMDNFEKRRMTNTYLVFGICFQLHESVLGCTIVGRAVWQQCSFHGFFQIHYFAYYSVGDTYFLLWRAEVPK